MKKVIAINGSPRRNGNTAELLQQALKGAQEAGAETELINLYSLNFKGCISCFYCKRKDKEHGTCAMKDDLTPVIERIKEADALIMGVPVYFMNLSSGMSAFIERLLFSNYIYSNEIPTVFSKSLPNAFIYTMNMTEEHVKQFGMREKLPFTKALRAKFCGRKPRRFMRTIRPSLPTMTNMSLRSSTRKPKQPIVRRCFPSNVQRLMN